MNQNFFWNSGSGSFCVNMSGISIKVLEVETPVMNLKETMTGVPLLEKHKVLEFLKGSCSSLYTKNVYCTMVLIPLWKHVYSFYVPENVS